MFYRKVLSVVLIIMMMSAALLCACSSEPEDGSISDIEIDNPEEGEETGGHAEENDNGFTEQDSPHDYEYMYETVRKAHLRFKVPKAWTVNEINSRHIMLQTRENDVYLPDTTIHLLCGYGDDVRTNEMSGYSGNDRAMNFSTFFKNELEGLRYKASGRLCHLRRYEIEDEIDNAPEFADEDHASDAATLITDTVVMVDKAGNYYPNEYGMVNTYFRWQDEPYCFSAVVPETRTENARLMLEFIVSGIEYSDQKSEGYTDFSYSDFSLKVPASFQTVSGAENIAYCPLSENSELAGISVGVFRLDSVEKMIEDSVYDEKPLAGGSDPDKRMAEKIVPKMTELALLPYNCGQICYTRLTPVEEENGPAYTGEVFVDCMAYKDPSEVAGTVFGDYTTFKSVYYRIEKNDYEYYIAVMYQPSQQKEADEIAQMAVKSISIRKK